jgi:RNA polymerase sigma-70 factor (ECF subfamily)
MDRQELLPNLFRSEYQKIVSVLCGLFGIDHIQTAEDIVSDTFLTATELWSVQGLPDNPTAWLYAVAKNKTKNYLKRNSIFQQKVVTNVSYLQPKIEEMEIDLSKKNISDSQLAMMFTVCNSAIAIDAQVALALNLLCGFGTQEIADAFLTNKEVVYKRLQRAKQKLKESQIKIEQPSLIEISSRLDTVLTTLYLLFSEGYYSTSQSMQLRKDLCTEAIRLTQLLINNTATNTPATNALLALMFFHSSRFDARMTTAGEAILYEDQNQALWNEELIDQGRYYLNQSAGGEQLTKFHLEAAIAYWHTVKENDNKKWENILDLYNELIILEYSPIVALNRTYALSKVNGKAKAIVEAEKLQLTDNLFYYTLLGHLYADIDTSKALLHFEMALRLAISETDKTTVRKHLEKIRGTDVKSDGIEN